MIILIVNCCLIKHKKMLFFPKKTSVEQQQQQPKKIKPFFSFMAFLSLILFCLSLLFMLLFVVWLFLSQAIAAGQTALRLALLPATERTSARGTRDLCQAGETQHTIPHTHAHQKKKKSLFFYLLFIHDDLANMVSISLIFSLMLAGLQVCVCEYHVKDALTYLLTSLGRERERLYQKGQRCEIRIS